MVYAFNFSVSFLYTRHDCKFLVMVISSFCSFNMQLPFCCCCVWSLKIKAGIVNPRSPGGSFKVQKMAIAFPIPAFYGLTTSFLRDVKVILIISLSPLTDHFPLSCDWVLFLSLYLFLDVRLRFFFKSSTIISLCWNQNKIKFFLPF